MINNVKDFSISRPARLKNTNIYIYVLAACVLVYFMIIKEKLSGLLNLAIRFRRIILHSYAFFHLLFICNYFSYIGFH